MKNILAFIFYLLAMTSVAWSQLDSIPITGTAIDTTKVYDGTTSVNIITIGEIPLLPYNQVTINAEAHYLDANVGEDKPVVVTFSVTGVDAYHYATPTSIVLYADITPLPIATDGLQLQLNREYDGTTDCEVTDPGTLLGVLPNDTVGHTVTASFPTPNVGFLKSVNVTQTLTSPQAGNYNLVYTHFFMGSITRRTVSPNCNMFYIKTIKDYDGTDTAWVYDPPTLQGAIEGEDIDLLTTANFDSPEVGDNKTIYVHHQLLGADTGNYRLVADSIYPYKGSIVPPLIFDSLEGDQQFVPTAYGFCSGEQATLRYHIRQGEPVYYQIVFSEEAIAAGFDTNWRFYTEADSLITFTIPQNCPAGHYEAIIVFMGTSRTPRNYPFSFNVNLDNAYFVIPFDDVISIDNSGRLDGQPDRFRTFQWYHNDELIPNANKPYYQELGGLTGKYAVMVNMGSDDEAMVCPTNIYNTTVKATISLMPSPVVATTTVKLQGFEETQHLLQVFNSYGVVVLTTTFEGSQYLLDLSSLPQGTYLVTIDGLSTKTLKL
jgi:hypothetical protein